MERQAASTACRAIGAAWPPPWAGSLLLGLPTLFTWCLSSAASFSSNAPSNGGGASLGAATVPQPSSQPASFPAERLRRAITPEVCDHLQRHGFAVVDGVAGEAAAAALRAEVLAVRRTNHMHKNHTHLVRGGTTGLLEKEHIWEAELMQQATQDLAPLCAQLQNDSTLRVMLSLLIPQLSLQSQAIKLQYNAGGGGCFPMHFDTDAAVDTRRVTAIWYLNPGWQPGHGGELRLYPFPQPAVDIAPANDRLVLFSSTDMLHRVLPSSRERCCFTVWMSEGLRRRAGRSAAGDEEAASRAELQRALSRTQPIEGADAWRVMLHPDIRRHAAKLRHCAEWEQSVRESHPQGPQLQLALDTFRAEVAVIARALAPLLPALAAGLPPEQVPPRCWF